MGIFPSKYNCKKCKDTGKVDDGYWGSYPCSCKKVEIKIEPIALADVVKNVVKVEPYKPVSAEEGLLKKNIPGYEVVPAKLNELQLDYDFDQKPAHFLKILDLLSKRFGGQRPISWQEYKSSSGKHLHVLITLPQDITHQERIVWQAVFGSDPMREGLNLLRVIENMDNPIALFMKPGEEPVETGVLEAAPGRKFKELESNAT